MMFVSFIWWDQENKMRRFGFSQQSFIKGSYLFWPNYYFFYWRVLIISWVVKRDCTYSFAYDSALKVYWDQFEVS